MENKTFLSLVDLILIAVGVGLVKFSSICEEYSYWGAQFLRVLTLIMIVILIRILRFAVLRRLKCIKVTKIVLFLEKNDS